jgi:hypothetical protein
MNLDAMTYEDLRSFSKDKKQPEALRNYAVLKRGAMKFREIGSISQALNLEERLERHYENLPTALQW